MKHYVLIFIISLILSGCFIPIDSSLSSFEDEEGNQQNRMPSKPGSCYAKSIIQEEFEVYYEELIVFTGDVKTTNAAIETIDFEIYPASTKWEKKRADKNCKSDDPNDCLLWCLTEVPAETKKVTIVTDTTTTDEYQVLDFEKKFLVTPSGTTEWREVVCQNDITKSLVSSICIALMKKGYYHGPITGIMNSDISNALVEFQKKNGHPVGQLDFHTLDGLEVVY